MKTLLLGLGNSILTDDAVGIRLAEAISAELAGRPDLDVVTECSAGGLALLDVVTGYDRVIVLDSIQTVGGRPGEWYRFTAASLRETRHLSSVHDANFATALALGRGAGAPLPADEEIHIFAVEIEESSEFGQQLGPALARALPRIRGEILVAVRELVEASPDPPSPPRVAGP